ncbi:DUF7673 family protein [Ramlibacter sp.]|uniref:DUF7673 family protein n=1 Tax=Ramlibacter sp. TaxID=1917967 RepID=UPI003D0A38ED
MATPTSDQLAALVQVFNMADGGDHGGAKVCQRFLLSLYNGARFPFGLTDLRRLDLGMFEACMRVLHMDYAPQCEVHVQLAIVLPKPQGLMSFIFERWGFDQRLRGRCKKAALDDMQQHLRQVAAARREAATAGAV